MNVQLNGKHASISAGDYNSMTVEIEGVDKDDVIELISIRDLIDYYGLDKVLDEIGEDECKDHFDLKPID